MFKNAVLCVLLSSLLEISAQSEATFNDVQFKGYSVYTLKFTKTIHNSDTLKKHLPQNTIYDHLEFINQHIPILKANSISDIEHLDELTIENSELEEIEPGALKNLSLLRKLSFKGNRLETIEAGVFNGLPLSVLDLGHNRIKTIGSNAMNDMPNLLNINLADNVIEAWNKRWFHNVPLLTRVSMQNNSLKTIPGQAFPNLKGNKKFGSLKASIYNINLIFSYNKISRIEASAFEGLDNINNLWLDHNELTEFPDNLLENVQVQDLRLEHNQIKCLQGDLGQIIKAQTTHMDGNPFDCHCLEEIKAWAKKHDKNLEVFYSDMNCLADRIKRKMTSLEEKLKETRHIEEIEPEGTTTNDVEVLF